MTRVFSQALVALLVSVPFWVVLFAWQWLSYAPPVVSGYFAVPRAPHMPMVIAPDMTRRAAVSLEISMYGGELIVGQTCDERC